MDNDDRALAHGRLAQTLGVLGELASSQAHERHAQDALIQHRRDPARVLEAFSDLLKARAPRAGLKREPC
jgi:hypothetical protein